MAEGRPRIAYGSTPPVSRLCDLAQGYYFSGPLPAGPVLGILGSPLAWSDERQGV